MTAVLDAGVLVAVDRRDRLVGAMLRILQEARVPLSTSAAVVGQVWRDGARQANLARVLAGVAVGALDIDGGKRSGELLAQTRTNDVVDAHLALLVSTGDRVLTSDARDIDRLLRARGIEADVIEV